MGRIKILKKTGEELTINIKEDTMDVWAILVGLKYNENITEQDVDIIKSCDSRGRNPMNDWAIFTDMNNHNLIINKRYIAWIEE